MTEKEIAEQQAIPVADILKDEAHPLHSMMKDIMEKLESGEISLS